MEPLGLSAYRVAKDIMVPVSRIQEILQDKRKITADTDLRLCKYFGMSKGFFLRLQMDLDLLEAEDTEGLQADLKNIRCITNSCTAD
jgi:addiction module antidote protein HigA